MLAVTGSCLCNIWFYCKCATFMYSCLIYGRMNILMLVYLSSSKTILFVECTSALPWECLLQVMDALLYPYLVIQTIGFVWLLFLTPVIDTLAMLLVGDSCSFTIQAFHMCWMVLMSIWASYIYLVWIWFCGNC